ncbi:ATP synthase F1 subunit gamma [Patescibacteria group bacterium]
MAEQGKIIKRRIQSITNTKQITKAMEMVAGAKMRKAVQAAESSRTYATKAWELLTNLSEKVDHQQHELLAIRPIKKICVIFFSSNRGLAGAFNSNLNKKLEQFIKSPNILRHHDANLKNIKQGVDKISDLEIDYITVGNRGAQYLRKNNRKVIAAFDSQSDTPTLENIRPITKTAMDEYRKGNYDRVVLVYSDFVSALLQKAKIRQLLPISKFDIEKTILTAGGDRVSAEKPKKLEGKIDSTCLFEPSAEEVLDKLLVNMVQVQIYQVALETSASKFSARMVAMRSATENAEEMTKELVLSYNQSRQAAITQEIAEIASAAESM